MSREALKATWFVTCPECTAQSIVDVTISQGVARWECPRCESMQGDTGG